MDPLSSRRFGISSIADQKYYYNRHVLLLVIVAAVEETDDLKNLQ